MKNVSKKIKECIRDKRRSRRQEKIQQILEEFKGVKNISSIKFPKKRKLIPKIKKKAKSSHQGKELPMSLENFTSNYAQEIGVMKRNRSSTRLK